MNEGGRQLEETYSPTVLSKSFLTGQLSWLLWTAGPREDVTVLGWIWKIITRSLTHASLPVCIFPPESSWPFSWMKWRWWSLLPPFHYRFLSVSPSPSRASLPLPLPRPWTIVKISPPIAMTWHHDQDQVPSVPDRFGPLPHKSNNARITHREISSSHPREQVKWFFIWFFINLSERRLGWCKIKW